MEHLQIHHLSDKHISYLLLRFINHMYGVGGISIGRSLESRILEAIFAAIGPFFYDNQSLNLDIYSEENTKLEAEKRIQTAKNIPQQLCIGFPDILSIVENQTIARCLLGHLMRFYKEGEIEFGGRTIKIFWECYGPDYTPPMREFLYVQLAYNLWPSHEIIDLSSFPLEVVIQEAEDRWREFLHWKDR